MNKMNNMKRYISILNALCAGIAALSLAACTKEAAPQEPVEEKVLGVVDLSSTQAVFPVEGGTKTVLVAANSEWYYDCDYTWLSITASPEDNTITFSADRNTTGKTRYGVVSVICGDEGLTECKDIKVMQTCYPEALASDGVTANCYLVSTGATYSFPATVKGNGKGDGNSKYIENYGVEIEGAAYAELIWEATLDADRTRSTQVIDGDPLYEDGKIYFTTGDQSGNAVIAVCAADGTVLWSWHIWVCADEIGTKTDANGLVWMDRNLGATSATPSDAQQNRGLFYQWGRKDPFLPSASGYYDIPTIYYDDDDATSEKKYAEQTKLRPYANVRNEQKGNGKRAFKAEEALIVYDAPGNAGFAVENPEKFLKVYAVYTGAIKIDWYIMAPGNETAVQSASNLWGNTEADVAYKSIFDPCPAGYVVPRSSAFATIPTDAGYKRIDVISEDGKDDVTDWEEEENGYGYIWKSGGNAFFPKSGYLNYMGDIRRSSEEFLLWCADPTPEAVGDVWGRSNCLFFNAGRIFAGIEKQNSNYYDPVSFGARAYAGSVRCVKE